MLSRAHKTFYALKTQRNQPVVLQLGLGEQPAAGDDLPVVERVVPALYHGQHVGADGGVVHVAPGCARTQVLEQRQCERVPALDGNTNKLYFDFIVFIITEITEI